MTVIPLLNQDPALRRFWNNVQIQDNGCWVWTASRVATGYGRFSWKNKTVRAHRMSWEIVNGLIPDNLCVCHHCDNPPCVNPDHLFLGTHLDNAWDRDAKGRSNGVAVHQEWRARSDGEHNGMAKLTEADVITIRERFVAGDSHLTIAQSYGVTRVLIGRIVRRQNWAHIPPNNNQQQKADN